MRRWLRRIAIAVTAIIAAAIAAVLVAVHTDWGRERARRIAVAQLEDALVGRVSIGRIDGSVFGELVIHDVEIDGADGEPRLRAAVVRLHVALWPLLSQEARLEHVTIDGLDVNTDDMGDVVKPGPPTAWTVTIEDVHARGHVRAGGEDLDDVELAGMARVPPEETTATIAMSARWRDRPVAMLASVVDDARGTAIPALVGGDGEVAVAVAGANLELEPRAIDDVLADAGVVPRPCRLATPAMLLACVPEPALPPRVTGVVAVTAPRAVIGVDAAALVHVEARDGVEDVSASGVVDGAPVYAYVEGDLDAQHARGVAIANGVELAALPSRGGALVAFDGFARDLPPSRQGTLLGVLGALAASTVATAWTDSAIVRAAVATDGERIRGALAATAPGLAAVLAAGVRLDGERVVLEQARLVARAPELATAVATAAHARVTTRLPAVHGALAADLAARGTLVPLSLAVTGHADGHDLRYTGVRVGTLALAVDARTMRPYGHAHVELANVARGDTRIDALAVDATDRGDGGIDVGLHARGDWQVDADATVHPGATTRVELRDHHVRVAGDDWTGTNARIDIGPRGLAIHDLAAASARGRVALDATVAPGRATLDARAEATQIGTAHIAIDIDAPAQPTDVAAWKRLPRAAIRRADVSLDAALAPLGLAGHATAELHVTPDDVRGRVAVAELPHEVEPLRDVTIDLAGTTDHVSAAALAHVSGIGDVAVDARARIPARPLDPAAWTRAVVDGVSLRARDIALDRLDPLRGRADLAVDADAGLRAIHVDATAHHVHGGPLVEPLDAHATASIDDRRAELDVDIHARDASTLATAHAELPITLGSVLDRGRDPTRVPLTATITLPSTPAKRLLAAFGRTDITTGTIDGTIRVAGTLAHPTGSAAFAAHDLPDLTQLTLDATWDGTAGMLTLLAREPADHTLSIIATGTPSRPELTIDAARFQLQPIMVLVPGPAGAVTGMLDGKLAITGLEPPAATGTLALRDARIPIAPEIGTLRKTSLDLRIADHTATFAITGSLGKGRVEIHGQAPLTGEHGHATITLRKVRPIGSVEPVIDADVVADLQHARDHWEATVDVSHALVSVPDDRGHPLDPIGPPDDFSFGTKHTVAPRSVSAPTHPLLVCRITLHPTRVESSDLRSLVDGKLAITLGTAPAGASAVAIVGDISAERGDLTLFGRRYQVDRAIAHFDGSLDPELDASMTYDFPDVTTITEVRGRLSKPELILRSSPATFSQGELLGFLLGGQPNGDAQQSQSTTERVAGTGTSVIANQLGGYVKGALPVDIDVLAYEAATAANSAAITVGTWLTHELFVAYRQRLAARPDENASEGQVEYYLKPRLSVEATAGDRQYNSVDLLWRRHW